MTIRSAQLAGVKAVLGTGRLSCYRASPEGHLGGPKVQELEALCCDYFNVKYAVAMSSATAALHAACIALELQGTEVIVPPVTFSASASCVKMVGGVTRFTDIQPDIYTLDPLKAKDAANDKTSAIIPVHLHGHPADMDRILSVAEIKNLWVIEDAAQSLGAEYHGKKTGTIGDCGIFSFNQSKHINCGEGGLLITNDKEIARIACLVRNHGETQSGILGYNYRLTEIQAAILIPQFKALDSILDHIINLCSEATHILRSVSEITPPVVYPNCKHTYFTYPVYVHGLIRNNLQKALKEKGVYFGTGGYKPLHLFEFYGGHEGDFPVAEGCYRDVMYTNIFRPPMKITEAKRIAKLVKETVSELRRTG